MSDHDHACFHCGLPVPPEQKLTLTVFDKERHFCCHGCYTVCNTIVEQGLDDYYRHRDTKAQKAERDQIPDILKNLQLYDNEEVQRSFVQSHADRKSGHTVRAASLILEDIRCAACLWLNEQHLRGLDGVLDVDLDYASQRARVEWDPERIKLSEILESIAAIGYIAYPYDASHRQQLLKDQKRRDVNRLIFAGFIGMMVMQFAVATYLFPTMFAPDTLGNDVWERVGRWTSLFGVITLLAYPAQDFFVGAWRDLKARRLGMDVPIVLGMLTALFGSVVSTVKESGEVYYDSIAMFIFLLLIARYVEMRGRVSAADALDRLARVVPDTARRVGNNGEVETVPIFELQPGDRVQVQAGENVPVDGLLLEGESSFDESLLTGESLPLHKQPGDMLIGGSGNREQNILMEVTRLSESSTANEIRNLLEKGMKDRPSYAILADRAAGWFVGIVLTIAAITATAWTLIDPDQALQNTIAVLIVTCPCALAMATPVAIAIGAGRFAQQGILPLRMSAMEHFAQGDVMVFDKTGTLTYGNPELTDLVTFADQSREDILNISASLESANEHHPVARAVRKAADRSDLDITGLHHVSGKGVQGQWQGQQWRFGSPEYLAQDHSFTEQQQTQLNQLRAASGLVVALGNAHGLVALLVLNDELRPGAETLIEGLKQAGIGEFAVLSGDHQSNVDRVAKQIGLNEAGGEAHGHYSSEDKLNWIQAKQKQGRKVIMVGDGINDAPTLAAANISLSFAGATEMAQSHSDYLLLGDDLSSLTTARQLAHKTRRIILQNLTWAAGYNFLAVPAAAMGYIPPWGAAIGMSLSSLLVVLNALRLKR